MATGAQPVASMPPPMNGTGKSDKNGSKDPAWQLRKYLLLLAILVATVTYVAGLDPPGGVWLETKDGHRTGNPILPSTRRIRYTLFYYFNATAFAASLVVIVLILCLEKSAMLLAVRGVMVLDLLCLMVAYVAGSCRGYVTTIYASVLCTAVLAVVSLAIWLAHKYKGQAQTGDENDPFLTGKLKTKEWRKVLMLLAIFVTTITYTAALNPPGGFWEHAAEEGHAAAHRAGDPILLERHSGRFAAFLVFNTTAFAASLVIMTLLLSSRLVKKSAAKLSWLYWCIAGALLGLVGAYAAGSCRETDTTIYIICLVGGVLLCISILGIIEKRHKTAGGSSSVGRGTLPSTSSAGGGGQQGSSTASAGGDDQGPVEKARSLILLLSTLAATVTYQAGLNPPGGVWRENGEGHNGGDLILLATHARRYKVFFYCNSAAFVASVVVVIMVQSRKLIGRHALEAAVILELFGLMGAYAAGSCRNVLASMYVFALACIIFAYVLVIYAIIFYVAKRKNENQQPANGQRQLTDAEKKEKERLEKQRKLLLLLAILAVTITYQAGLTPPGKFWLELGDEAHHVGDPVLADNYPRRYMAFFYCNATSFMASVAVIVILVGRDMSDIVKKWYYKALYVCMAAGLAGLLVAYAAGTTRRVKTSIYVFALVAAVLAYAFLHIHVVHEKLEQWIDKKWGSAKADDDKQKKGSVKPTDDYIQDYKMRKYLMLLGILAASVTYQAGLDPPGGVWPADSDGHAAGAPALHDVDRRRYHAFFYSNSASFVASVVVIVLLLLLQGVKPKSTGVSPMPIRAMHTVVVLDLLGLLVAYATGSCRGWGTSAYVLAMAATVLAYVAIYTALSSRDPAPANNGAGNPPPEAPRNGAAQNGAHQGELPQV